jgi:hypothetical protein
MAKNGKLRRAILCNGKFCDANGNPLEGEWVDSLSEQYVGRDFRDDTDRGKEVTSDDDKEKKRRRGAERLGKDFVFHDDGKDRGEDWRNPIIKASPKFSEEKFKASWEEKHPGLTFAEADELWERREYHADEKAPGVPSDLLNFVWDGPLAQHGEENDEIRAAQAACLLLADREPDTLRRRDWRIIVNEVTCEPVWMQMGPKRMELTRRKLQYQERAFPVLNIGSGLIRIRRSLWLPPPNKDPLFVAACEYVKRPDRVTSWSEACRKYNDPVMIKGAKALAQLAKWYRPLVGRIVKEFWGRPKEYLTELGMVGLAQAIRDFPVDKANYSFATHAETAIRREIHDTLRGSTLVSRYLYANPAAMVDDIAANAGYKNIAEAREHAAAGLAKRDTETGPNRQSYDVREIGFEDGGEDGHSLYVESGHVDSTSLGTALLNAAIAKEIEREVAATEIRRPLASWEREAKARAEEVKRLADEKRKRLAEEVKRLVDKNRQWDELTSPPISRKEDLP